MNFIEYQVISFLLLNKIMNRNSTQPPLFRLTKQDIKSYLPKSRVQLKTTNPEITPIKQNKSDLYKYQNQDDIKSPFQKDQFLQNYTHNRQFNHNHHSNFKDVYGRSQYHNDINKAKHTNTPQLIKISQITTAQPNMSKSWTSHTPNVQQDYNLQEIINEISDKRQYQKAKRQIYKLQNRSLKYKLQNIISKLQAKQSLAKSMEFISARQSLVKILRNHFRYEKSVELYSTQRIIKQLQKSILSMIKQQTKVNRKQSQQKIKQMKQESKLLNSKLQKQTNELNKVLEKQKLKLKQKYQEIYRKIYEETNKLKKEFQNKELELQKQRKQTETIKIKYQNIFTQISQQFQQIKKQYNKLIESSSKQLKKNKHLQEQNKHINKKLAQQQNKLKQYQLQFLVLNQKNRLLEDQKKKLQTVNSKYKGYAEKFINQTKKYREEKEKMKDEQKNKIGIKDQQHQLNILMDIIKNKQEIICKNSIKIQQYEANIQQKIEKIQELDQKIENQAEIYKNYNNKINHQINQLQKLQKMFEQTQELVETKQKNYGQLSQKHNLLIQNCKQKQQQSKSLAISVVLQQLNYAKLQQENSLIEAKYASTLVALRELQENAEKLRKQNQRERETQQNLEKQIGVINKEIIVRQEKLMHLKIDQQIQEQKLLSQATELKAIQQQKQNKHKELQELQKLHILAITQNTVVKQQIKQLEQSNNVLHAKNEELNLQILNKHRQIYKIPQRKNMVEQKSSLIRRIQQQKHYKQNQISILSQIRIKKKQEIAFLPIQLQERQKQVDKCSSVLEKLNNQIQDNKIILQNQLESIKNNQNTYRVTFFNMQQLQQRYNQELHKYEKLKSQQRQLQGHILEQQTKLKLKFAEKTKIQEQICTKQIKFNQMINKIQYIGQMQQENKKIIISIENQQQRCAKLQQENSLIEAKYASTLVALRELQENAEKLRKQNQRERETQQNLEKQIGAINEEIIVKQEKLMRLKIDQQIQEQKLHSQVAELKEIQQQKQNKHKELQQASKQVCIYSQRLNKLQSKLQQSLDNEKQILNQIDKNTERYNSSVILCKKQEEVLHLNVNNNNKILLQIQNNRAKLAQSSQQLSRYQNLSLQLIQQLNILKTVIDHSRNCQHELQKSIKDKQQEIKSIQQMLSNKYQLIKSIQNKFRELELNISCFQKQNESNIKSQVETNWSYSQQQKVKNQVDQIKLARQMLSAQIELMKKQKQHLIADLRQLEASLSQISTYLQTKREQIKYIQKSLSAKYEQLVTLQSEILIKRSQL